MLLRDLLEHWKTIFKQLTAISKNVYIDVLDDIVNKYNNTVHKTIKMKPIETYEIALIVGFIKKPWMKLYKWNFINEIF